jgi:tRNA pseudouridine55 synthase
MRRALDGILLLDKPSGISSNAALQRVKRHLSATKAGHGGTLDPLASGLLPIVFGEATKFAGYFLDADKAYEARLVLGAATVTGDAEGEVITRAIVDVQESQIRAVLGSFHGVLMQTPPMYSALKLQGTPLYKLAREGQNVPREPRQIVIRRIELLGFTGMRVDLYVECSKGTYIRTLVEDIASALGSVGHLGSLRRIRTGDYAVGNAMPLDAVESTDPVVVATKTISLEAMFERFPRIVLGGSDAQRFQNGGVVRCTAPEGKCGVFDSAGALIGMGVADLEGRLTPKRLRASEARANS